MQNMNNMGMMSETKCQGLVRGKRDAGQRVQLRPSHKGKKKRDLGRTLRLSHPTHSGTRHVYRLADELCAKQKVHRI